MEAPGPPPWAGSVHSTGWGLTGDLALWTQAGAGARCWLHQLGSR